MVTVGLSTIGCFPDVAAATDGGWYVCWQIERDVIVARVALDGTLTVLRAYGRVSDLAFPRVTRDGRVAYRGDDAEGSRLYVNGIRIGETTLGGNHPILASAIYVYAQHAPTNGVYRYAWDGSTVDGPLRYGAGTGLSRLLLDGTVRTMDEDRGAEPGMTCPAYTAHVVAGEHPESGVLVRHDGLGTARAGAGTPTFTPKVAYAQGHWCVVTHGDPHGVRAYILSDADFSHEQVPPPDVPPHEPPKEPPVFQPTAPNRLEIVERCAREHPEDFRDADTRNANSASFVKRLAWWLYQEDHRFGLNGKRGSDDLSHDAVSFRNPASAAGGVEIIDVVAGAAGPTPRPAWQDVTQDTIDAGAVGKWIAPSPVDDAPPSDEPDDPPHIPPADGPINELAAQIRALNVTVEELRDAIAALLEREPRSCDCDPQAIAAAVNADFSAPVTITGRLGASMRWTGRVGKEA